MEDRLLFIVAAIVATIGTVLLASASSVSNDRYILDGTVVSVHGRESIVSTNVTLVAASMKRGAHVSIPVFWGGQSFVAVPDETTNMGTVNATSGASSNAIEKNDGKTYRKTSNKTG